MMQLLVLTAWTGSGVVSCRVLTPASDGRSLWPIAALFGPLWAAVAVDREAIRTQNNSGARARILDVRDRGLGAPDDSPQNTHGRQPAMQP